MGRTFVNIFLGGKIMNAKYYPMSKVTYVYIIRAHKQMKKDGKNTYYPWATFSRSIIRKMKLEVK